MVRVRWRSATPPLSHLVRYARLIPHSERSNKWRVSNLDDASVLDDVEAAAFILEHGQDSAGSMWAEPVTDPTPGGSTTE